MGQLRASQALVSFVLAVWAQAASHAAVNITPPNLSGNLSGSLPGMVDVGPSGAASYSIPLTVPPGTAGQAPTLNLSYSSQAGTGMLGLGWKLGGQSQITRCGKTLATDSVRRPVKLDSQDQYCLDGQRLKLVSGTHGAAAEYRTEIDGFSRIKSFGADANVGPTHWTVETKGGQILSYGTVAGALLTVAGPSGSVNLTWGISRSEDRSKNYITYHYADADSTGEFYITRIRYTGNDAAGYTALAAYNSINFVYEDRPDPWQGYVVGVKLQRLKRLTSVEARINTNADGSGGTLVRQYKIAYTASPTSGRSLVQSVSDCNGSNVCLPATTFNYSVRTANNTLAATGSGDWGGPHLGTLSTNFDRDGTKLQQVRTRGMPADLNGDGKTDLLYGNDTTTWKACLSTGTAFDCQNWTNGPDAKSEHVVLGDFDADGRTDVLLPGTSIDGGDSDWKRCLSTGAGWTCTTVSGRSYGRVPSRYLSSDFDGDGRDDVLVIGNTDIGETSYLCKSTGTSFTCAVFDVSLAFSQDPEKPLDKLYRAERNVHDLDGDGRSDILNFVVHNLLGKLSYTFKGWVNTGSGFVSGWGTGAANFAFGPEPGKRVVVDSNGDPYDSYADIHEGGRTKIEDPFVDRTCHHTGIGFTCYSGVPNANNTHINALDVADYDGDGRLDVLTAPTAVVQLAPGGERSSPVTWTGPLATSALHTGGDFNGDGLADIAYYTESTGRWTVSLAGFGGHADLLEKVTNGFGLVTQLQHKPLHDSSVYTRGADVPYPKRNQASGMPVVSQMQVDADPGTTTAAAWLTTTYKYEGLRSDQQGRGSLGFAKVIETDQVNGIVNTTTYSQDFPHIGQALTAESKSGTVVLTQSTHTLKDFTTSGGARHAYVRQAVVVKKDLNGAALGTTTTLVGTSVDATDGIDTYGNVTSSKVTVVGGDGKTATTTLTDGFSNNATTWVIGRKTSSVVAKTLTGATAVPSRKTTATYTAAGLLETETVEPDKAAYKVVTTHVRDPQFGVVTEKKLAWRDPQNIDKVRTVEKTTYDTKSRFPFTVTNAKGHVATHGYDAATGTLTSLKDPNDLTTTFTNDAWGRKTKEARPDGTFTTWDYKTCVDTCAYGATAVAVTIEQQWVTLNGVDERTVVPLETFHDKLSRKVMTRTWDAQGGAVVADWIHDVKGKVFQQRTPHAWADRSPGRYGTTEVAERDVLGRATRIKVTNQAGTGTDDTTVTYDGLTTTTINAKLQSRTTVLNVLGKVASVTDAKAKTTTYAYDPFGNLKTTSDPLGNQISVTYDDLGRKTQMADPDLGTWNYKVDALGQTYEQTDAKLQKTTFTFDDLGRLTDRVEPDQQSHWVYDTEWMGIGKLAEAYTGPSTAKDFQRLHTYDSLGRPARTIHRLDWDYSVVSTYNSYGDVDSLTHRRRVVGATTGGRAQTFNLTYNNQGAVHQVSRGGSVLWTRTTQEALGTTKETFGSGIVTTSRFNKWTGRLEGVDTGPLDANGQVTASIQNDEYTYDQLGNLLTRDQLTALNGATVKDTFAYDDLNRLKTMQLGTGTVRSMGYDDLGNITSKPNVGTYVYPASGAGSVRPHAISSITGTVAGLTNPSFSYDANGNLELGLNRGYQWSAANYPIKIDELTNGQLTSAFERTEFVYGPDREKARQLVRAMSGQTEGAIKRTIHYGTGIEKEVDFDQGKTFIRTYLPEGLGFVEEVVNTVSAAPGTAPNTTKDRFFHTDHLGSPTVITDIAGAEVQRMSYDAWGRRRQNSGADDSWASLGTIANNQDNTGYTGQEQLDQIGLVHLNGRVYDPIVGRMLSADPTVPDPLNLQSLNRFSYVQNNALAFVDPTGFAEELASGPPPAATNNFTTTVTEMADGTLKVVHKFTQGASKIVHTIEMTFQVAMGESNSGSGSVAGGQGMKAPRSSESKVTKLASSFSADEREQMHAGVDLIGNPQGGNPIGGSSYVMVGGAAAVGGAMIAAPAAGGVVLGQAEAFGLRYYTNQVSTKFAADWTLARGYLSANELAASARLTAANYGKAMERAVAEKVLNNPILSRLLDYSSKPFKKVPDFTSKYTDNVYDITTKGTQWGAQHLKRGYEGVLNLIEYVRPAGFHF